MEPPFASSAAIFVVIAFVVSVMLSAAAGFVVLRDAHCLAEGVSPTSDGAGGGGGVATLIAGLARPNPWQQYGCGFTKGSRTH